jgi:hypothetical protein
MFGHNMSQLTCPRDRNSLSDWAVGVICEDPVISTCEALIFKAYSLIQESFQPRVFLVLGYVGENCGNEATYPLSFIIFRMTLAIHQGCPPFSYETMLGDTSREALIWW